MDKSLVFTKMYKEDDFTGSIMTDEYICLEERDLLINALWDTGSSGSVISSDLVTQLNLKSIGSANVGTTSSSFVSNIYNVTLLLNKKQRFTLMVTESQQLSGSGIDFLVGMDIISLGDFAISTHDGLICFSFRYPPKGLIDFTKQEK